jgi:hypothetical protein
MIPPTERPTDHALREQPAGDGAAGQLQRGVRWPDAAIGRRMPTRARTRDPPPAQARHAPHHRRGPPTQQDAHGLATARATGAPSRGPPGLEPPRHLPLTARPVAVTAVSATIRNTAAIAPVTALASSAVWRSTSIC